MNRMAEWCLLSVYEPGQEPVAVGILLRDLADDKLYYRVDITDSKFGEDVQEVLWFLEEELQALTAEDAGKVLSRFEREWSHTFRLSSRITAPIDDPKEAVNSLFQSNVSH